MIIYRTDKDGNKIKVEVTETVIEQKEQKPPIYITDDEEGYKKFKECTIKNNAQNEFLSKDKDRRYELALADLITRDRDTYNRFFKRMQEEFHANRK